MNATPASTTNTIGNLVVYISADAQNFLKVTKEVEKKVEASALKIVHHMDKIKPAVEGATGRVEAGYGKAMAQQAAWFERTTKTVFGASKDVEQAVQRVNKSMAQSQGVFRTAKFAVMDYAAGLKKELVQGWQSVMHHMTGGAKGWNVEGLTKGLLHGLGIGTAMSTIHHFFGYMSDQLQASSVWAKELDATMESLNEKFRGMHAAVRGDVRQTMSPAEQLKSLQAEVKAARDAMEASQTLITQSSSEFGALSRYDQRPGWKGMMGTLDPAGQIPSELRWKYYKTPWEQFKSVLPFVGATQLDVEKKIQENTTKGFNQLAEATNRYREAMKALQEQQQKMAAQEGDLLRIRTEGETEILRQSNPKMLIEAYAERGAEIRKYIQNALLPQIKTEQTNRTSLLETRAALSQQAMAYRGLTGEIEKLNEEYRQVMRAHAEGLITPAQAALQIEGIQGRKNALLQPENRAAGMDPTGVDAWTAQTEEQMQDGGLRRIEQEKKTLQELYNANKRYFEINLRAQEAYNWQVQEYEYARQHLLLASAMSIGESLTSIAKDMAGEQSGIYKAMFAVNKAFAIADAIISIQQGIASAAKLPFPANLGAMATVAAATASIVSNIRSVALSFEGGGYTGDGARSGGVDGKGGFMAILHPRETVIDETTGGGGGAGMQVNIHNYAGVQVRTNAGADGRSVDVIIQEASNRIAADIRDGRGPVVKAMERAYKVRR